MENGAGLGGGRGTRRVHSCRMQRGGGGRGVSHVLNSHQQSHFIAPKHELHTAVQRIKIRNEQLGNCRRERKRKPGTSEMTPHQPHL